MNQTTCNKKQKLNISTKSDRAKLCPNLFINLFFYSFSLKKLIKTTKYKLTIKQ